MYLRCFWEVPVNSISMQGLLITACVCDHSLYSSCINTAALWQAWPRELLKCTELRGHALQPRSEECGPAGSASCPCARPHRPPQNAWGKLHRRGFARQRSCPSTLTLLELETGWHQAKCPHTSGRYTARHQAKCLNCQRTSLAGHLIRHACVCLCVWSTKLDILLLCTPLHNARGSHKGSYRIQRLLSNPLHRSWTPPSPPIWRTGISDLHSCTHLCTHAVQFPTVLGLPGTSFGLRRLMLNKVQKEYEVGQQVEGHGAC